MVVKKTSLEIGWELLATAIFKQASLGPNQLHIFSVTGTGGLVRTEGLREVASRCATARNLPKHKIQRRMPS